MAKQSKKEISVEGGERAVLRLEWPRELVHALGQVMRTMKTEGLSLLKLPGGAVWAGAVGAAGWCAVRVGQGESPEEPVVIPKGALEAAIAAGNDAVVEVSENAVCLRVGRAEYRTAIAQGIGVPEVEGVSVELELDESDAATLAALASLVQDDGRGLGVYVTGDLAEATDARIAAGRRLRASKASGSLAFPAPFIQGVAACVRIFGGRARLGRRPTGALVAVGDGWAFGTGAFSGSRRPPIEQVAEQFLSAALCRATVDVAELADAMRVAAAGVGDAEVAELTWGDACVRVACSGVVGSTTATADAQVDMRATVAVAIRHVSQFLPRLFPRGKAIVHIAPHGTRMEFEGGEYLMFTHSVQK